MESFASLSPVEEAWGWQQLISVQLAEYWEAEAYASHVGQFIHKDSKLDKLRKELSTIKTLEWIVIEDGKKTPLVVKVHHTSEQLLQVYNELATLHRGYESRVNFYKALVKNSVTEENAKIAKENQLGLSIVAAKNTALRNQYETAVQLWEDNALIEKQKFEETRTLEIQGVVNLRIQIEPRFQDTVDQYLKMLV